MCGIKFELWDVFSDDFGKNWERYNGPALRIL